MGNRGEDEVVWARSEKDGKELWVSRLGPAFVQRGMPQGKEGPASDFLISRKLPRGITAAEKLGSAAVL
jgi:hypothetical protein